MAFPWVCPFCQHAAIIRSGDFKTSRVDLEIENADGLKSLVVQFIVCPNKECRKYALHAGLYDSEPDPGEHKLYARVDRCSI